MKKQIDAYIELLRQWNCSVNLVQSNTMIDVLERHVLDSEQICRFLKKDDFIVDIGSGAGFPGVVLAINGFKNVTLCEKNQKKVAFLRTVRKLVGIDFDIFDGDVFKLKAEGATSVSRAFGSLSKLLEVMLVIGSTNGVFHKGESHKEEIEDAMRKYAFDYNVNTSATSAKGVVLEIYNVRRNVWG